MKIYLTGCVRLMFVLSIWPLDRGLVAPVGKQTEGLREHATGENGSLSTVNKALLRRNVSVVM
jgi:hypothetical protein